MEPALRQGVQRAKDEIEARYWGDPNIVGLGVALRRREGRLTAEVVVRVMVEKKRPAAYVSRHRLLPAIVGDRRHDGLLVLPRALMIG